MNFNKIRLIIEREYSVRVRKRSFIAMSILGPLFIAAIFVVPLLLQKFEQEQTKDIAVIDDSYILAETLKDVENIHFHIVENMSIEEMQKIYATSGYYAVLYIPKNILNSKIVQLFSEHQSDFGLKILIEKVLEKDIETLKLVRSNVNPELIKNIQNPIRVATIKWTADGNEIETTIEVKVIIGIVSGWLIFIFIFMFGMQVMRGVIEEKTNRIVEIIVSSVKPIELMIGKIVGIGLVGLTQFVLWLLITFALVETAQITIFDEPQNTVSELEAQVLGQEDKIKDVVQSVGIDEVEYAINVFDSVRNVNWFVMISSFLIYFVLGYLLYSAIFAALGSAIDNETDTQQFLLPLTMPLVITLLLMQIIIYNPDGNIAFWLSIIPFTSPIAMLVRIPFGVSYWQVFLSIIILVATFVIISKMAAKIYRNSILVYGKKFNFVDIFKRLKK